MSIFRLDPTDLNNERWQVSELKEPLFVRADNPTEARDLVARKTMKAQTVRPGEVLRISPWLDRRVASCVLEPADDVPEGVVEDATGNDITDRI